MAFGATGPSQYDTAEQRAIVSQFSSAANTDIDSIRAFINQEDSDFVSQISGLDESVQLQKMRSWLARKHFNLSMMNIRTISSGKAEKPVEK